MFVTFAQISEVACDINFISHTSSLLKHNKLAYIYIFQKTLSFI